MVSKDKAKEILRRQIGVTKELEAKPRFETEFYKWKRDTEVAIENIFGLKSRHMLDFQKVSFSPGSFRMGIPTPEAKTVEAYAKGFESARSILGSMIEEIDEYGLSGTEATDADALSIVERLCNRFHIVARQLRSRREERPTLEVDDEYDVQDLLHAMLRIQFDDIRPEEWTPSYAGSSSRMDFLLKKERIVVEAKKTRKGLGAKELGEQLIVDIAKYRQHPDCKCLVCFAYDPEARIANPKGIENDLTKEHDGFRIVVIIAPKGA